MSTCLINSGFEMGCRDNAGGLDYILLANYPTGVTGIADFTAIDPVTEIVTGFTGIEWYKYVPNKTSSDYVENYQVSIENGTTGYEVVVNFVTSKMTPEKRLQIKSLTAGNFLMIAKDKNGRFWLPTDSVNISGGNAGMGKALSDLNGYNLTFTSMSGTPAMTVEEAAIILAQ